MLNPSNFLFFLLHFIVVQCPLYIQLKRQPWILFLIYWFNLTLNFSVLLASMVWFHATLDRLGWNWVLKMIVWSTPTMFSAACAPLLNELKRLPVLVPPPVVTSYSVKALLHLPNAIIRNYWVKRRVLKCNGLDVVIVIRIYTYPLTGLHLFCTLILQAVLIFECASQILLFPVFSLDKYNLVYPFGTKFSGRFREPSLSLLVPLHFYSLHLMYDVALYKILPVEKLHNPSALSNGLSTITIGSTTGTIQLLTSIDEKQSSECYNAVR